MITCTYTHINKLPNFSVQHVGLGREGQLRVLRSGAEGVREPELAAVRDVQVPGLQGAPRPPGRGGEVLHQQGLAARVRRQVGVHCHLRGGCRTYTVGSVLVHTN